MAADLYFGTYDALYDFKRLKTKCQQLDYQCNDRRKLVEEKNIERDYQALLRFISGNTEMYEQHKRESGNVIYIDEEDDGVGENDPQYEHFLNCLKEHEKSYVLEDESNGTAVFVKYEAKSCSEDEWEPESQKNMSGVEQIDGPSNWKNQCEHYDQVRLVNKDRAQSQIKSGKKVAKRRNVVKGDHGADIEAVVKIDNRHLYKKPGPRNNWVTENKCEHDQARPCEKDNVPNQRKLRKVVEGTDMVKGHREANKKPVVQIDKEHLYCSLGPRNNRVTENQRECVDEARTGKQDKLQSHINLQQLVKRENVVRRDPDVKTLVQLGNGYLHQKPGPRNNWLTEYQSEHVNQARPVKKDKVQTHRKFKGKNMVKGDNEANRKAVVQIDNEHFYQKPGSRNNWVTRNHCERVDQAQPGKKDEVQGHTELMKVVKEEKVVQGNNGLSNQKSVSGNYAEKNKLDCNVTGRSGRKDIHRKFKNVKAAKCSMAYKNNRDENNQEKEGDDEIAPEVEILDSAAYLKEGTLSSFVPSKKFHKSMEEDDFQHLSSPSASDEFRKQVLNVLRKPFDKEEYIRHREAVRLGSYLDYHPDLGKKLKRHRYRRGKCLTILRGFFFWLQNLTQEGAFQPWHDRQCLAVDPGSP